MAASKTRSIIPVLCLRIYARFFAKAKARSAGSRFPATPRTSTKPTSAIMDLFPDNDHLSRWLTMAQEQVEFQGLPARICWLGYGDRAKAGLKLNEMVASGELKRADRDRPRPSRLRLGRLAQPRNRSDEGRLRRHRRLGLSERDDQRRRRRHLGLLHHGGGVGIGYSLHAGQVIVADGTPEAARRIERVLTTDPGMGVIRHVDAGYDEAIEFAKDNDVKVPMVK